MSKATVADVTALGFHRKTFEDLAPDDSAWSSLVQAILDEGATIVADRVGASVYAAASGLALIRLKKAEAAYAAQELFSRKENVVQRAVGDESGARFYPSSENIKSRDRYRDEMDDHLAALGAAPYFDLLPGGVTSAGVVDTSHFSEDQ